MQMLNESFYERESSTISSSQIVNVIISYRSMKEKV